jgi:hypothetical protein
MKITSRGLQFYIFLPLFVIFFAVPYLFDLAFCEELSNTPLSQAALIDAEKVDPDDGSSPLSFLDAAATEEMSGLPTAENFVLSSFLTSCGFRSPIPHLLTSRPPPTS